VIMEFFAFRDGFGVLLVWIVTPSILWARARLLPTGRSAERKNCAGGAPGAGGPCSGSKKNGGGTKKIKKTTFGVFHLPATFVGKHCPLRA